MVKTYRAAIVGGRRGVHHARAYQDLENMEVVAPSVRLMINAEQVPRPN